MIQLSFDDGYFLSLQYVLPDYLYHEEGWI